MPIDHAELVRLTEEYGGQWGIQHTRRLLKLIDIIGAGLSYDSEAVWLAAHLHDWGGYGHWAQPGVDHAVRSLEVAREYLTARECPPALLSLVLECIEFHHAAGSDRSVESTLLRDADTLDFLGVVGVMRDFSKNPRDMRKAMETAHKRRERLPAMLALPKARELAAGRLRQMDELLEQFEADSFGCY